MDRPDGHVVRACRNFDEMRTCRETDLRWQREAPAASPGVWPLRAIAIERTATNSE